MTSELVLWAALGLLIALLALAVWAGRKGLRALGVVGPGPRSGAQDETMRELIEELRRLNTNIEALVRQQGEAGPEHRAGHENE